MDIFIGGGGDDLAWLGLGVMRAYADDYAAETGRPTLYSPNARVGALLRRLRATPSPEPLNLIGHSWGALDAYNLAAKAQRCGIAVDNLITLDAVGGLIGRVTGPIQAAHWLNVATAPESLDGSDRLTQLPPWSRKPSRLPTAHADADANLDLHHWDVGGMMRPSQARRRLDDSWANGLWQAPFPRDEPWSGARLSSPSKADSVA